MLVEDHALDLLRALTVPAAWHADILDAAETMIVSKGHTTPVVDVAAIDAQLQRLATVYADGLLNDMEYARRRDALRAQRAVTPPPPAVNLATAMHLLGDLATLVDAATRDEQRALLRSVFKTLWIDKTGIHAITPTALYLPLVGVMCDVQMGWLTGLHHPFSTPVPLIWNAHRQPWCMDTYPTSVTLGVE